MTEDAMGTSESLVTFVTHTNAASFCGRAAECLTFRNFIAQSAPQSRQVAHRRAAEFSGYTPSMGF